jgi:hypothetical protein
MQGTKWYVLIIASLFLSPFSLLFFLISHYMLRLPETASCNAIELICPAKRH